MPIFDKKFVAFGRIIQGLRVFKLIDKVKLCQERPIDDIKIIKCGTEAWWSKLHKSSGHKTKNFG
jgi:cyclophilin family peptidyl-prolyl cis-trans isomerase